MARASALFWRAPSVDTSSRDSWSDELESASPVCGYVGDSRVVNAIDSDGWLLASSGIERTVKLWRPNFSAELDEKLSEEKLRAQLTKNKKFNTETENSINVPIQFLMMLRRLRANTSN